MPRTSKKISETPKKRTTLRKKEKPLQFSNNETLPVFHQEISEAQTKAVNDNITTPLAFPPQTAQQLIEQITSAKTPEPFVSSMNTSDVQETNYVKSMHRKNANFILMTFILGISITVFTGYLLYTQKTEDLAERYNRASVLKQTAQKDTPQTEKWTKPKSSAKGYPIFNLNNQKRNIEIYDFATKTVKTTNIIPSCCGGTLELGNMDPLPSPNLFYTAYIDESTKDLWLLSNETQEKKPITKTGNITYVTGWSPNSEILVYYVSKQTLSQRKLGMVAWETTESFSKQTNDGFYMFNINTGENLKLGPLESFISFVDNTHILTRVGTDSNKLAIFDIDNFSADYVTVADEFPFGTGQFTISADGEKWAFYAADTNLRNVDIVASDFPRKDGVVVDYGKWAQTQWPLVSPSGKQLVYAYQSGNVITGVPKYFVWHYYFDLPADFAKTEKVENPIKVTEGRPLMWVDENTLIIERALANRENDDISRKPYLLDLKTATIIEMVK